MLCQWIEFYLQSDIVNVTAADFTPASVASRRALVWCHVMSSLRAGRVIGWDPALQYNIKPCVSSQHKAHTLIGCWLRRRMTQQYWLHTHTWTVWYSDDDDDDTVWRSWYLLFFWLSLYWCWKLPYCWADCVLNTKDQRHNLCGLINRSQYQEPEVKKWSVPPERSNSGRKWFRLTVSWKQGGRLKSKDV